VHAQEVLPDVARLSDLRDEELFGAFVPLLDAEEKGLIDAEIHPTTYVANWGRVEIIDEIVARTKFARESFHKQHLIDLDDLDTSTPSSVREIILPRRPGRGNRTESRGRGDKFAHPRAASRIVSSVDAGNSAALAISEDVGIPLSTVQRKLKGLVLAGVLERTGRARATTYKRSPA
jgi:hypothetical protein